MKGTDVPDVAIDEARQFLQMICRSEWPDEQATIAMPVDKLIRIVAWYGEIRAKGGSAPGYLEKRPRVIVEKT